MSESEENNPGNKVSKRENNTLDKLLLAGAIFVGSLALAPKAQGELFEGQAFSNPSDILTKVLFKKGGVVVDSADIDASGYYFKNTLNFTAPNDTAYLYFINVGRDTLAKTITPVTRAPSLRNYPSPVVADESLDVTAYNVGKNGGNSNPINAVLFDENGKFLDMKEVNLTSGSNHFIHGLCLSSDTVPGKIKIDLEQDDANIDYYFKDSIVIDSLVRKYGNVAVVQKPFMSPGSLADSIYSIVSLDFSNNSLKPNDVSGKISGPGTRPAGQIPFQCTGKNKKWFKALGNWLLNVVNSTGDTTQTLSQQDTLNAFESKMKTLTTSINQPGNYKIIFEMQANNDQDSTNNKDSMYVVVTPSQSGWTRKADMPPGLKNKNVKWGGSLVSRLGKILGLKGNNTNEFYQWDPATDAWAAIESLPFAPGKKKRVKDGAALTNVADTIYALRGGNTTQFWKYNGNNWTQLADVITYNGKGIKKGGAVTSIGNKIYALQGNSLEFYCFDTESNKWSRLADVPSGPKNKKVKGGGGLAALLGKVFALKGGNTNEAYLYDPATNQWTQTDTMPFAQGSKRKVKDGGAVTSIAETIYALRGNKTTEFWKYTQASGWQQLSSILTDIKGVYSGGALTNLDGVVYALRGRNTREFWSLDTEKDKGDKGSSINDPNVEGLAGRQEHVRNIVRGNYLQTPLNGKLKGLYNMSGQLLGTFDGKAVDISHLPAGVYVAKVLDGKDIGSMYKFVKVK
jgi:hypothetical protein